MPRRLHLALLLALTLPAAAQQAIPPIDDPANLMGERVAPQALADELPIDRGAPALEQLLRKLRTRASLMLIVAHPDDEDSGMLTYESRGRGARVAMLTLTRGEGGQNLMSADFNDALGLIRTQELLAEDRYTGTDQFFGTEVDFGFSKTKAESFRKWTHERVLYDAVRAVRLYRPLVLASVFIGGVTDGHGQHQVAGEITQEVFLAAADPKVFPEMGLPPWAPLRVYARVPFARIDAQGMFDYATGKYLPPSFHNYVTGTDTTTPPVATVTIHEGEVPAIPAFNSLSYAQWARQGLALQKTQIGPNFRPPTGGRSDSGYTLYGSRENKKECPMIATASSSLSWEQAVRPCPNFAPSPGTQDDFFSGIDTSLVGIADLGPNESGLRKTLKAIDDKISFAQDHYTPNHPDQIVRALADALHLLGDLMQSTQEAILDPVERFNVLHELRVKAVQTNNALILAASFNNQAQAHLVGPDGAPRPAIASIADSFVGDAIEVQETSSSPLFDNTPDANAIGLSHGDIKKYGKADDAPHRSTIKPKNRISESCPYFERSDIDVPYYDVEAASLRGAPSKPAYFVTPLVSMPNGLIAVPTAVSNGGAPLRVVAPINVRMLSHIGIFRPSATSFPVEVKLETESPKQVSGTLRLTLPPGWTTSPEFFSFALSSATNEQDKGTFTFIVTPKDVTPETSYTLKAQAKVGFTNFTKGYRQVGYSGLPYSDYCFPATYTATAVDVTTAPNLRVAYLPGTGDDVPRFLPQLGVTPTILTVKDLTPDTLNRYDAILLGVRAYSAHPELAGPTSGALAAYAKQGGVVIVQYSSAGFKPESAPFLYTVPGDSAHNVVEEEHPVRLLAPENPLLTWPNRITPSDFDHWIEERGHGFASDWAPEYTPLLEMHDDGQDPQKGGLLVAKVGKGAYIYCALALYRQLPEGVPGAYRLFANLLSYANNPGR
jgi:LmbE family N-acetylglucosaminyl deacetylase